MKFALATVSLALLVAVVSGATTKKPEDHDFRNEFDFLLMHEVEERVKQIEAGLLHLSEQVAELEKTKKKELKEQILREITIGSNFLQGAVKFFERESKRTDLDLFEKYNFDTALAGSKILIKDLEELAKKVKAIKTN